MTTHRTFTLGEIVDIKLILTDIDSTILPAGASQVSARTVAAFHAALDAGIAVGPCSGRGYAWIAPFFGGDAACCSTAIATNGLQIYLDGEKVLEKTLPGDALRAVAALVADVPHAGLVCFDAGAPQLVAGSREDLSACFPAYGATAVEAPLPAEPVVKTNVFCNGSEEEVAALAARINERVPQITVDRAMPRFSNMMTRGWNKGAAILWICKRMGISTEQVVVFGDGNNDLPMFDVVENSVAVANAVPDLAAAARWHIGACEDDAVAAAIESIAAGEWPFEA